MRQHDPSKTTPVEWRAPFEAIVRERMTTPFAWASQDCCLFAADAVMAMTGEDPAVDVRGRYSDAAQAARVLADVGGIEAAGQRAGDECKPLAAGVGDIGLVMSDDGREMLGVCVGEHWLVPGSTGLVARPLDCARKAWKVKHA